MVEPAESGAACEGKVMTANVVVVGSLSMDLVVRAARRPASGETLSGTDFNTFPGGKGNNQAIAAARAGASVAMVGRIGTDTYGDEVKETLESSNVSTAYLFRDEIATGIANIWVDEAGENAIIIVPQANSRLSEADVERASSLINGAKILLLQLEVPLKTTVAAAQIARRTGVTVILNPAPAPRNGKLPAELLQSVDILVPNETELELLTGCSCQDMDGVRKGAQQLISSGARQILVTLGARGAVLYDQQGEKHRVAAFKVDPVDTTAAGDAFCGALAAALSRGESLHAGITYGCAAGAIAVTKPGATPSLPHADEISRLAGLPQVQPT